MFVMGVNHTEYQPSMNIIRYIKENVKQSIWITNNIKQNVKQSIWITDNIKQNVKQSIWITNNMAIEIWVNIGSGNDLLPNSTKLSPETMLNYNQRCSVTVTWVQFQKKCSWIHPCHVFVDYTSNSLWSNNATWWHRSVLTLVQVIACYLMAPSHYLNQCWLGMWVFGGIHLRGISQEAHEHDPLHLLEDYTFNSLGPSDAIWPQISGSTLAQVMACCLMAPSHYLNQCWLMISEVLWHSPDSNFTENT